ncbi:hypothetical protein DSM112329_01174 [Paraconexibacter sp. AEG42_29]|uniref:Na+-translocating membrane potential-generating system MpsC domain-containing protein n=1 Tax=Paraconexibacter sp. AEG42_29 TaxID=2997339 RepID=A0AAU7AS72_9ACTN
MVALISDHVVTTTREWTGRGPTRARTYIQGDLVTTVLQDILNKGERSLAEAGKTEVVLAMRWAYQQAMREELVSGVERITGRKVAAFMSANHLDPDIAIESFVLEPVAAD